MLARASSSESFMVELAHAAEPGELRAWFAAAVPGETCIYASGPELPRAAEAVKLVGRWIAAGEAESFHMRDPKDRRRWRFLARKLAPVRASSPLAPERGEIRVSAQKRALMAVLAKLPGPPGQAKTCPSNGDLAEAIGLPAGRRGRNRANYLLRCLVRENRITLTPGRHDAARRVCVVKGRGR